MGVETRIGEVGIEVISSGVVVWVAALAFDELFISVESLVCVDLLV